MRIVIKPLGLALILIAIVSGLLVLRFVPRNGGDTIAGGGETASPPAVAVAASSDPNNLFVDSRWHLYLEGTTKATMERVPSPDNPSQIAHHYVVEQIGKQQWNIGVTNVLEQQAFAAKEPLALHFEAKSAERMQVCLILQKNSAPFPHSWKQNVTLTPDWQPYDLTVTAEEYATGQAVFAIQMGLMAGTMDIKNLRLERKH